MTPQLAKIVADAYDAFAPYRIGTTLTVCHCNCCMTNAVERELVSTPLRQIPAALLAEYTNSAHGWDDDDVATEMRYFLPRYLELIAHNDPPDHIGLDICLRRIGRGGWRGKWPAPEEDILDAFFDAFLLANLPRLELQLWPSGWHLAFDLADVLTMAVTAGADTQRLLAAWRGAPDPQAVLHMAALRSDVLPLRDSFAFDSPYLEDHVDEASAIGTFLMAQEIDDRIEAAFFQVEDPRYQGILSAALQR